MGTAVLLGSTKPVASYPKPHCEHVLYRWRKGLATQLLSGESVCNRESTKEGKAVLLNA